jgi:hypothetical protein
VCHAYIKARDRGGRRSVQALMRSDALSRSYAQHVAIDWEHHYVLMEKNLQ